MYFDVYIPSLNINRLFMALVYIYLNYILPHRKLEKQSQVLLFACNFEDMGTEYDPNHIGVRYGWPGALLILYKLSKVIPVDYPNCSLINVKLEELRQKICFVNNEYTKEEHLKASLKNWGISGGLTGLGLLELKWPGIFQN
jgi:hypothetical protein